MSYLSLGLSLMSIIGCLFNIKKKSICWLIWELNAIGFSIYFLFIQPDFGSAVVWLAYIIFDAYGWIQWRKEEKNVALQKSKERYISNVGFTYSPI